MSRNLIQASIFYVFIFLMFRDTTVDDDETNMYQDAIEQIVHQKLQYWVWQQHTTTTTTTTKILGLTN